MRKILITLFASLAVHAAPLALMRLPLAAARAEAPPPADEPLDRWTGTTAEIGHERVYDVSMDPPGANQPGAGHPAAPALPPSPPPPPAPAPPPPGDNTKDTKPSAPSTPLPPRPSAPSEARKRPSAAPDASASADSAAARRPRPGASGSSSAEGPAEERSGGSPGGSFGAEGPGSVRDLGRAFTRAIPPACQADLTWSKLAAGNGGRIDIAIAVDETGHITGFKPVEEDPPKHLLALVKRTIALLEAGTFAVRSGAVSAGTEVLRIHASLRDLDDGEAGGAAGLSFAYERGKGKAGFAQPGGRHVEVSVEVLKVVAP